MLSIGPISATSVHSRLFVLLEAWPLLGQEDAVLLMHMRQTQCRVVRSCGAFQVQPYGSVGLLAMLSVGRLRASAALHAAASCLELHYQLLTQLPAHSQPCEVLPNWEQQETHAAGQPLGLCIPPMPSPR